MPVNVFIKDLTSQTVSLVEELRKQRNPNIVIWLYREEVKLSKLAQLIVTWRDIRFIDDNHLIDNNLYYYQWDTVMGQAQMLSCGLRWLISRCMETPFCALSSEKQPHNSLVLFKDAPHLPDLPDSFIKIPCFDHASCFFEYCQSLSVFNFSLDHNPVKFVKASGVSPVQGATVYKEIETNNLWYLDMFHKTHYEVFDPLGKIHLGEADREGSLDKKKRDKEKKPIVK